MRVKWGRRKTQETKVIFRPVTGKGPGQLGLEFYDEAHLYGIYERLMKS